MKSKKSKMISVCLKEGRLAKGYTQKELSDLSNISVRSIQRIENGELIPRSHTLKTLSEVLDISWQEMNDTGLVQRHVFKTNNAQRIILSISIPLFILLACWAFIAQSPRFPETAFELLTFTAFVLLGITVILVFIWRTKP